MLLLVELVSEIYEISVELQSFEKPYVTLLISKQGIQATARYCLRQGGTSTCHEYGQRIHNLVNFG